MKIYTFYIDDDRYGVPTLLSEEITDDVHALLYANQLFAKSDHYLAIDIWDDERLVGRCPCEEQRMA